MGLKVADKYSEAVGIAVSAAIGLGPLGIVAGAADAIGIAAIWTTLFVAMANISGKEIDANIIKATALASAKGAAAYYMGCKVAAALFALIPFAGVIGAIGISSVANVLFTWRFALAVQSILSRNITTQDIMIEFILQDLKQLPSLSEIKEIIGLFED